MAQVVTVPRRPSPALAGVSLRLSAQVKPDLFGSTSHPCPSIGQVSSICSADDHFLVRDQINMQEIQPWPTCLLSSRAASLRLSCSPQVYLDATFIKRGFQLLAPTARGAVWPSSPSWLSFPTVLESSSEQAAIGRSRIQPSPVKARAKRGGRELAMDAPFSLWHSEGQLTARQVLGRVDAVQPTTLQLNLA